MQISQRGAHIADRMDHIRPDDEVERRRFQLLLHARLFEIENLELHFRKRRELLLRAPEKNAAETSLKM